MFVFRRCFFGFFCLLCCTIQYIDGGRLYMGFPTSCPSPTEECIAIRTCPYFEDLLMRSPIPRPRNVIKIIRDKMCGFYKENPYVCCEKATPPPPTTITTTVPTTTTTDTVEYEDTFFEELDSNPWTSHKNYRLLANDICGPIGTNSRITSGSRTGINEFPWMALMAYRVDGEIDFRCGGTLINERYVLTAAHCIRNMNIIGVRLGEYNLDTQEDCDPYTNVCSPQTQDFYIESILVHPAFDPKTLINDIALVRLIKNANLSNEYVQPICLPVEDFDLTGRAAIVTGWGVTETGVKSPLLLKVSLPVVSISKCQRVYRRFARVTSNQICAGGYQGKDSCGGDSGGPMQHVGLIDGTPRFIQYGIVSYGPKHCGTDGKPGIYTRVSKYIKWILDNLRPADDDYDDV